MIQQTSLAAYHHLLETNLLGKRQKQVYEAIKRLHSATNLEISKFSGLPINSVTPRVKELREKGFIGLKEERPCKVSGRIAMVWCAGCFIGN